MNVVYVHTHDSGRFWQPYGQSIPMPHMMAFAAQSVLFRQAYCAAPTCSPSRAALMTGMAPHTAGMLGLAHRGFSLNDSQKTMASWFARQGFETVLCGVQHEAPANDTLGYTRLLPFTPWLGVEGLDMIGWDSTNANLVCDYLRETHEKPFFLSYGMVNTHRPYPAYEQKSIRPEYIQVPHTVPDTAENREDMADYHCAAMAVDDCVGRVLDTLRETGLIDDTIILLTTDHGIAWPFMKCNLYDTGIGVAMLMRLPHGHCGGTVCDKLVSQVDVFPTLCEAAGVASPSWLQGVSMIPAVEHGMDIRDAIFAEVNYHAAYEPMRCIRTSRYKLIVRYDDYEGVVAPNIDDSPSKTALYNAGYMEAILPREELYDLVIDPMEKHNLIGDSRYCAAHTGLAERLQAWMIQTQDPLLTYHRRIPAPDGAKVNCRTGYDPETSPLEG